MLALTFTWRAMLIFLVSESVTKTEESQLLISDEQWPQACVLDCTRGRHRAVCASNGRMYKTQCAFQRAKCINSQLRTAAQSVCTADPLRSRCQMARAQALRASARSDYFSAFIPECKADGSYTEVQCHTQTGFCWCSTPDGVPVSGSSVLHLRPNCTGHVSDIPQETHLKSAQAKRGGPWRSTRIPKLTLLQTASKATAPPFWMTIQLNSDPNGSRSVRQPTGNGSLNSCEHERTSVLAEAALQWSEERFVPECSADGRYNPVQCHGSTRYCWCVRVESGRPVPGTSTRNQRPDCSQQETHTVMINNSYTESLSGCPSVRKADFVENLLQEFQQEVEDSLSSPHRTLEDQPHVSPSVPLSPVTSVHRYFKRLDVDANGILVERETRPLRLLLRRILRPRRCARKFFQSCDQNADRSLSASEFSSCLGV